MLIKGISRRGDAIKLNAKEAIPHAVTRAIKALNTRDTIYWVEKSKIHVEKFHSMNKDKDQWEAWVEGRAWVGQTKARTGRFYVPKEHSFKVHYKTGKDSFGLPDIELAAKPEVVLLEKNPTKLVGDVPVVAAPKTIVGELKVEEEPKTEVVSKRNQRKK